MTTELLTERLGSTLQITLSGPATRNALSPQVYAAGIELLNVADSDPGTSAVIITGAGGHFCGGGDLQRLAHNRQHDLQRQGEHIDAFHQWIEAIATFPKPVIAAVEGVVAGGGLSLALACDLLVAGDNTRFVSAYSKMALSPDGGGSWQLARRLPRSVALSWLWQGGEMGAHQLAQWGVIHQIAPAGTVLTCAQALAESLSQVPAHVLTSIKELVNDAPLHSLTDHLAQEKQHFLVNLMQPAAGHAMQTFLQRKHP
jgi:enoyl-CoA hydratase/carnithine racemase